MKLKLILVALSAIVISACGQGNYKKGENIAYKSSKAAKPLEFPPDLTSDNINDSYALPTYAGNTLSDYESARSGASSYTAGSSGVLPQYSDIQVVRIGAQRFIQTSIAPQLLWPRLRDFWLKTGFIIEKENAAAGIMETNWAENRAELKDGPIRRILSKVLDSLYSTGTRDKFRTRIERNNFNEKTEIIISHQRLVEKLSGSAVVWTQGKPQPALEGEIMARLVSYLGASKQQAAQAKSVYGRNNTERARLSNVGGIPTVLVLDNFDNAWRLVGNALDRSGFAVEDRNRSAGIYYVRYEDPIVASQREGFLTKVFGRKKPKVNKYLIHLTGAGAASQLRVTDRANRILKGATSNRILKILHEQLR